jgi:hypothetical protein
MKQRRKWYQWLADKWHIQVRIDQAQLDARFESGIRVGVALVTEKPAHETYHGFGQMVSEQASGAMERLKSERAVNLASYELPEKQTDSIKPVQLSPLAKLLPMENLIGKRETQSLPAIGPDGYYMNTGKLRAKAKRFRLNKLKPLDE